MKNEKGMRDNMKKEDIVKSAKENQELVEFIKSITSEEIKWVKEVRKFQEIKPGTPTHKLAVLCDALRTQIRTEKLQLRNRLNNIDELTNNILRLKVQLETGNITERIKGELVMNESELKSLIKKNEFLREGEFVTIPSILAKIRANVGHKDVARNIIMTQEEFDSFVSEVNKELKSKGYDMFGELA